MYGLIEIGPVDYVAKLKERTAEIVADSNARLKYARDLVITTDEDLRRAKEDHVAWRDDLKAIEENRKSITVPINAALDLVNAAFKEPSEILKMARVEVERKAVAYEAKKEAERREIERKAQEAARKEEERLRKEKEAQEAAWRAKEEAARREAEELARKAAETKNEAKKAELAAQAEKARQEAAKAQEKAEERAQQAAEAFVPAPIVEKVDVKVAGTKRVIRWFARIIDKDKVPVSWAGREIRPVDQGILNEIARGLKTDKSPIEGVQFYSESRLA